MMEIIDLDYRGKKNNFSKIEETSSGFDGLRNKLDEWIKEKKV